MSNFTVAVASGKGGTGKTTVAANLASIQEGPVQLLDCDVEEPNVRLFFRPHAGSHTPVYRLIPSVDAYTCTSCGMCCEFCRFSALVKLTDIPRLYEDLCHSCGGCAVVCPAQAIHEVLHESGTCTIETDGTIEIVTGELRIGERSAVPVIREVKRHCRGDMPTIVDVPPGTSCSFVEAVDTCDHVLLVAEPSPFGLHDLRCTVEALDIMEIPCSVLVNRSTGSTIIDDYCSSRNVPVISHLREDIRFARCIAEGDLISRVFPELRRTFSDIWEKLIGSIS